MFSIVKSLFHRAAALWRQRAAQAGERRRTRAFLRHCLALAASEPPPARADAESITISLVVPTYNTPPAYLDDLVASFLKQAGAADELILSDDGSNRPETHARLRALEDLRIKDPRIRVVFNGENRGIAAATNAGIAEARGIWIALADHDDALFPHALDQIRRALRAHPACRFLYTDEIITDGRLRPEGLFLKPAWDPVLLSGVNYVNHLSLYRREGLMAIGGLRPGFEGSQDYDLLLRYTRGLRADEILHLPYPAYLWRRDGASYSATFLDRATAHARAALGERFGSSKAPVPVGPARIADLHRVRFDMGMAAWPPVTVILPSLEAPALIEAVLAGLLERTDYPALDIVVVDNGSRSPEVLEIYRRYRQAHANIEVSIEPGAFNFAHSVNRGVAMARGEHLLILNNDIEILDPDWLKEMVSCLAYEGVGIVGAKLLFPDRTLQHAGVIVGFGGLAGHWYLHQSETFAGPMARLGVRQSFSAVTGACMLVSRACWARVGGFDTDNFAIAYNDVDYCLRARRAGFRVVWTPFATLLHHESATRGSDETPENIARFRREQDNLRRLHATDRYDDSAINPWYSKDRATPEPILLKRLPPAR
jgi:O-antigen biosynthesis protein